MELPARQRDVVIVPFPFSDQSDPKLRPAIVLSSDAYNRSRADVILCAVTSSRSELGVRLGKPANLRPTSYARPDAILKADKDIIQRTVGRVQPAVHELVVQRLLSVLR